jgi:hypothetical protein
MKLHRKVVEELTVDPGKAAGLADRSTHTMDTPWRATARSRGTGRPAVGAALTP